MRALLGCVLATLLAGPSPAAEAPSASSELVPFVLPWDDGAAGPTDLGGLSHRPAGKFGHVRAGDDGHLYAGRERIRFFGINCDGGTHCPEKEMAEAYAARMAKFGFNIARFHHLDFRKFPAGLIRRDAKHSADFDPEALDRMDYFLAQLKARGVYVNLNLLTGRHFQEADGLPKEIEEIDWKDRHAAAFFHPKMIELQEEYARRLLARRNPYTGLAYTEDPCVAFVEIINEHGLLNSWFDGKIDRLPGALRQELQDRWNAWLKGRYASAEAWRQAWGEEAAGLEFASVPVLEGRLAKERALARRRDWLRFLYETEGAYYGRMKRFLRDELKVRAVLVGTIAQMSTPSLMADLGAIDVHFYWNHPRYVARPGGPWYIQGRSMVEGFGPTFGYMSWFRVEGRPFSVTEYSHCPPSPYASEGPLLMAAYAALQDWDAIYLFSWGGGKEARIRGFFAVSAHPAIMANAAASAALFRRADVRPAREAVRVAMPPGKEFEGVVEKGGAWSLAHAGQLGVDDRAVLVHRVAMRVGPDEAPGKAAPPEKLPPADRDVSDTGELAWDRSDAEKAMVTIDAPRVKGAVGCLDGRTVRLGEVEFAPGRTLMGWCTLTLALLEGDSFAEPKRALLVATGRTENTGMTWKAYEEGSPEKRTIDSWGEAPTLTEVFPAVITVPGPAARVTVYALDERGQRGGEVKVEDAGAGRAAFTIGPPRRTLWYEVVWR